MKSLAERLWWVKIMLIKYKRRNKRKMSKINRAGCSKMLLPQSLPRSTRILWFKYCLQSRQFYEGSNDCFFSLLVLLIFTPSNFLSFLFGSIMFRHIYGFWLPFSVAKISDTFEQHHPNPKWWHRQIPCPVHEDNPDFATLLRIKRDENENDAIRNRISDFDSTKNPINKLAMSNRRLMIAAEFHFVHPGEKES